MAEHTGDEPHVSKSSDKMAFLMKKETFFSSDSMAFFIKWFKHTGDKP